MTLSETPVVVVTDPQHKVVVEPDYAVVSVSAPGPAGPPGAQGPPGVPGGSRFNHNQATPSALWSVQHNLGYEPLFATVIVAGEDVTDGADIYHIDLNNLIITFSAPVVGKAAFL